MSCPPLCAPGNGRNEHVLVIDDDESLGQCVECILQMAGHKAVFCTNGSQGLERLAADSFDLVITDLKLPDVTGIDIVRAVKERGDDLPVILMTSFSSVESAVEALRLGATDYLIKPFRNDDFAFAVQRALNERRMRRENAVLKRSLKKAYGGDRIIGESRAMKRVMALVERVAATHANVLLQGESGTGKELVAQAIHFAGPSAEGPFVPVNCGAIPSELLESELFGHTKGAFTGAVAASEGLIREASGGTLFLDEISELPLHLQVKLLRVIQERQVRPLGSTHTYTVSTRFIAASNRDLKRETEKGAFRADLFYRLNVISIVIPPLRERGTDIELLARHFLEQHNRKLGKRIRGFGDDFVKFVNEYTWPGNVRELENLIERAVILSESDVLTCDDLLDVTPLAAKPGPEPAIEADGARAEGPLSIESYIREFIVQNQDRHTETELAAMLGMGRKALWMRRRRWGLYRNGTKDTAGASGEAESA